MQDRIILPANHYSVTQGELVLQTDFIFGAGARTTVIDALNNSRVLRVGAEGLAGISGVTITHGNGTGSTSSGTGGGIFVGSGARLALVDSHVLDNTAGGAGGGIGSSGLSLSVVGSTISGNESGLGGGIAASTGSALIRNSTVSGNSAVTGRGPSGGGIYATGSVTLENATIAGNQSVAGGGFYHQTLAGQTTTDVIRNTIIAGNTAAPAAACRRRSPPTRATTTSTTTGRAGSRLPATGRTRPAVGGADEQRRPDEHARGGRREPGDRRGRPGDLPAGRPAGHGPRGHL